MHSCLLEHMGVLKHVIGVTQTLTCSIPPLIPAPFALLARLSTHSVFSSLQGCWRALLASMGPFVATWVAGAALCSCYAVNTNGWSCRLLCSTSIFCRQPACVAASTWVQTGRWISSVQVHWLCDPELLLIIQYMRRWLQSSADAACLYI